MKFRLRSAHYFPGDLWLPGDTENADRGETAGTLVGDGTKYSVCTISAPVPGAMFATLEMEPLDQEAEEALEEERDRIGRPTMDPVDDLPLQVDKYEDKYIPGFGVRK